MVEKLVDSKAEQLVVLLDVVKVDLLDAQMGFSKVVSSVELSVVLLVLTMVV